MRCFPRPRSSSDVTPTLETDVSLCVPPRAPPPGLDRDDQSVRIRLNATALRVQHVNGDRGRDALAVTY
jgi:hypothetical protein